MSQNRIPGINKTALWRAWKAIRPLLRNSSIRDVIDYLEYDVDPDVWIKRLLHQINTFNYEPSTPIRFPVPKVNGFSRILSHPSIPDLTLYRALVDHFYTRMRRHEVSASYFERSAINAAQEKAFLEARSAMRDDSEYGSSPQKLFLAWLKYDEYRRQLIMDRVHQFIVTVDISNYFDSILHSRLAESLHRAGAHAETVGLLFFLIERLALRPAYTDSPGIGLPVDEFDCSRRLAHVFLFTHDRRMLLTDGVLDYTRWMDDQVFGTETRANALRVIGAVGASLAQQHLTPNTSKSRIFTLNEAKNHFHLVANADFRAVDEALASSPGIEETRDLFLRAWSSAVRREGQGEWEKILKWAYRLAGRLGITSFRKRAVSDVLKHPRLTRRIADYMRTSGSAVEFVAFAEEMWNNEEQVYPDVNLALFESFLRLEPDEVTRRRIRSLSVGILRGRTKLSGLRASASIAPLAILRFGDRRSLSTLEQAFIADRSGTTSETIRSAAIVYASYGQREYDVVKLRAAELLRHRLTDLVRLVDKIREYREVPKRFKPRLDLRFDSVSGVRYFDMRAVIALRLLALSPALEVQAWVIKKKASLMESNISDFDKSMLARLINI